MSIVGLGLHADDIAKVAEYTVQKIKAYPKEYGITVDNYFDILFQNELTDFAMRRNINRFGQSSNKKLLDNGGRSAMIRSREKETTRTA